MAPIMYRFDCGKKTKFVGIYITRGHCTIGGEVENKTRELLEKAPWGQIIPELLKFALYKARQKLFEDNGLLEGAYRADIAADVVMESIRKILDGTRSWDPDAKDDLTIHLKGIIKSEISHLDDDDESKATGRLPTKKTSGSDTMEVEELLKRANPMEEHAAEIMASPPLNPVEVLEDKERLERDNAAMNEILERVKGDSGLEDVVLCIMEGITKPSEIAEKLGVDVKDINNRQKRLRRTYKDLLENARKGDI